MQQGSPTPARWLTFRRCRRSEPRDHRYEFPPGYFAAQTHSAGNSDAILAVRVHPAPDQRPSQHRNHVPRSLFSVDPVLRSVSDLGARRPDAGRRSGIAQPHPCCVTMSSPFPSDWSQEPRRARFGRSANGRRRLVIPFVKRVVVFERNDIRQQWCEAGRSYPARTGNVTRHSRMAFGNHSRLSIAVSYRPLSVHEAPASSHARTARSSEHATRGPHLIPVVEVMHLGQQGSRSQARPTFPRPHGMPSSTLKRDERAPAGDGKISMSPRVAVVADQQSAWHGQRG